MEDRLAFINEFRTIARRKGTNPEDLFLDWDPENTGVIKYETFRKILSSINMWIEEGRLQYLVRPFFDHGNFKYADFMRAEKLNTTIRGASDEDVIEFGRLLKSRRIILHDTLEECDRHHCGHVPINYFLRTFGSTPLTLKICERFKNGENEVEYLELDREIRRLRQEMETRGPKQYGLTQELPPFFSQVAYDINAQHIDPYTTFLGLDKLKRGLLEKKVFHNALYSFNLKINAAQLCQLVEVFANEKGDVPYNLFCDEIKKAVQNLPPSTKSTFSTKGNIQNTLAYLRDIEKNRHSQIGNMLKTLDPLNTGVIPSARFFKTLNAEKYKIGPADVDVLEREYTDGNNGILYRNFLRDITPVTTQLVPSAFQIIGRLRDFLQTRQIQLRPRLIRYDRDRSGRIIIADLAHALHSISFDFSGKEWTMLSNFLGPNNDATFLYGPFCDDVDPVLPEPTPFVPEEEREIKPPQPIRERPPENIINILVSIIESAKKLKISIYEEFRARDALHKGIIPTSQFQSLILHFNPYLSNKEVSEITDFYHDQPFRVNYENLYKDIQNYAKQAYHDSQTLRSSQPLGPRPQTIDVLRRLKSNADYQRYNLLSSFYRYDASRSGCVLKMRLAAAFQETNTPVTREELDLICTDFQDNRRQEFLNYRALCSYVDNLELTKNDLTTIRISSTSSNVNDRQAATLVNSLRERIHERHKRVRDPFSHYAPGVPIPARDFRAAIASFGLIIGETDYLTLLRYYRFNRQGDVDWERFCHDVETSKTVEMAY